MRGGGHDARQVVVAEHQRPLDGARGEHDAIGADAVQALARLAGAARGRRQVILQLLDGLDHVHVVQRERAGARHDA